MEGIQLLFDVEQSSNGVLFLGLGKKKIVLIEETSQGERHSMLVPDDFHPKFIEDLDSSARPRLIATNNKTAAIAGDAIWWFDKNWKSRKLPKVPQFYKEFRPGHFGDVHYLDGTTLYVGWNRGEWGGMLASIDISVEGANWVHLSGKPVGDYSGIPQNNPIHSIISSKKGHIWVGTGLAHLGGTWRGLHHRDSEGRWHTLIDGDFKEDRGPMKLPSPSSIQGVAVSHKGQLYILAGNIGILRLTNGGIEHLIKHNFFSHSSDRGDYIVGSYPSKLGISRKGDIYVSTNSFGVLAFRKLDKGCSARQIALNERNDKELDANSLPPSRSDKEDK